MLCRRALLLALLSFYSHFSLTAQAPEDVASLEDEGLQLESAVDSGWSEESEREEGAIPGQRGHDYPVYKVVPTTSFTCTGRLVPGYYADPDTRCQVFHICGVGGAKYSFLCPEGSVFNQLYLVCDWWHRSACGETLIFTQQLFNDEDNDVEYRDNFPSLEGDTEVFQRAETGSPTRDQLANSRSENKQYNNTTNNEVQLSNKK